MKKILSILFVFIAQAVALTSTAYCGNPRVSPEKIGLKVLYVGYSPEKPMPSNLVYYSTAPSVVQKAYKTRMADFKIFLESRFNKVEVVDVRDYMPVMSDQADVTIMDAGPVKLPADFDRPMILMHAMAPNVGLPIGLKFDWYCQCLDDEALNIKTTHEIFNKPKKVNLTMVTKPTPGGFFNGFQGESTPKKMPMWQVVKPSANADGKYLIGMVSHGEGFNDSPDAEVISGGVCMKNAEAVALGRQGNYFMWGFAGSPDYMTEEAKDVFVNTICYIRKFDHMPFIVKKVQETTREDLEERIYRINKSLYEKAIVSRQEGNARLLKMQQDLRDRMAAGENVGKGNEMLLKITTTNDKESFADYLKNQAGDELFKRFGTNVAAYHKYYRDNYEYFYPSGRQSIQLDEDVQKLGISNRKLELLEKCIQMLEKQQNEALAHRLLERYTTEKFATAAEWRSWYAKNKNNLFYTEAGGFKFMVNTFGQQRPIEVQVNSTPPEQNQSVSAGLVEQPTTDDPVAVSAKLVYGKDKSSAKLFVSAAILKGWHTYALIPKDSPFIPTEVLVELPDGIALLPNEEWQSSAAIPFPGNEGVFVFEGNATFSINISLKNVKPGASIKCGLSYQTCDENKCFPPNKKMVDLKI